jgi:hypothetical protein
MAADGTVKTKTAIASRLGFVLHNPVTSAVVWYIGFTGTPSTTSFNLSLRPGQTYQDLNGATNSFVGNILGLSSAADTYGLQVTEITA